jgi:hypothetical protein
MSLGTILLPPLATHVSADGMTQPHAVAYQGLVFVGVPLEDVD